MSLKRLIWFSLLLLLLPGIAKAGQGTGYDLPVLQMDESGVVLELRLTDFTLETREHAGVSYQMMAVPGLVSLTEPGQPQLPGLGKLLGTPPAGIAQINILETEVETLQGIRLWPTPALTFDEKGENPVETFSLDAGLYGRDAFFPASPAEVGQTGYLRDQPVAQVRLYPFQYNPVRQILQVYRRLRVQVVFASVAGAQANTLASRPETPYERLLQSSLLNYASLPPSRSLPPASPGPAELSAQDQAPALKIFVDADGLYRVTSNDLQGAGFTLSGLDPRRLRLVNQGSEVAIYVQGEADGVFDPGDWLEFYGTAMTGEFTGRNVYWLTIGAEPGLRMAERDGTPTGPGSTPTAFYTSLHLEENHEYWSLLPNGAGQDHWFWQRLPSAPYTSNFSFNLHHLAPLQADGLVRVSLYGRTDTSTNPDHHTQILLNGTLIDEVWWDGQTPLIHEVSVPQQLFQEGSNRVTVKMPGDTGATVDSLYVNWLEIGYWDSYAAENNQLYFTAPTTGTQIFTIRNFNNDEIYLYDVSDPLQTSRLMNGVSQAQGNSYRLKVKDDVAPGKRYLALTASQKRAPAGFLLDTPSHWKSPDNRADYLIITHKDFTEAMARLADYRAGQGLRVGMVQIEDIYDEFSGGVFNPGAIRDFLSYAYYHWTPPAPLYVLLVGDANYDYKDYLATGHKNYLPTHLVESNLIGQVATDNWFVSVSGDDLLPDLFIGRLTARTLSQANIMVDKILAYEQNSLSAWNKSVLFVADDEPSFEVVSDELITQLPPGYASQRIYASLYPRNHDPAPDIITAINQGKLLITYIGHGNVNRWGLWRSQAIFPKSDIAGLQNGPLYPFLVTGNCNNGAFAHPTIKASLAEEFVHVENKGSIAAWSPTGLGYTFWHQSLIESLYQAMFDNGLYELGPATATAKIAAFGQLGWNEPIEIFTLFGDPVLALQIVQPRLSLSKAAAVSHVQPGQLLTYLLTYSNDGNESAENVTLTELYDNRTIYHSASPPPTSGNNIWQIGSLPAGVSATVVITVQVAETVTNGMLLSNEATLSSSGLDPQTATAETLVGQPILALSKVADVSQIQPGQFLTYTLTYTNTGNQPVESVVLTETYDPRTVYHSASLPSANSNNVWEIGSLPAGGAGLLTITVRVSETIPHSAILINQATIRGDGLNPETSIAYTPLNYPTYLPLIVRDTSLAK